MFSFYRGGITYSFHEDGTYEFRYPRPEPRYPARFHSGYYEQLGDTVVLMDTLCYSVENYLYEHRDTVMCEDDGPRYLYKSWFAGRLCLTRKPIDPDEEVIIDQYYLKRE